MSANKLVLANLMFSFSICWPFTFSNAAASEDAAISEKGCEHQVNHVYDSVFKMCDIEYLDGISRSEHASLRHTIEGDLRKVVNCHEDNRDADYMEFYLSAVGVMSSSEFYLRSKEEIADMGAPLWEIVSDRRRADLSSDCDDFVLVGERIIGSK